MPVEERELRDLVSIGPAMLRDFELQVSQRNSGYSWLVFN